jgi:hypothetical protein
MSSRSVRKHEDLGDVNAPSPTLEDQKAVAQTLFVDGALLMRDRHYLDARRKLEEALTKFEHASLVRESNSVRAQLKQLKLIEEWETVDVHRHAVDPFSSSSALQTRNQSEALFREISKEISQDITRKQTEVTLRAGHVETATTEEQDPAKAMAEALARERDRRQSKTRTVGKPQQSARSKTCETPAPTAAWF